MKYFSNEQIKKEAHRFRRAIDEAVYDCKFVDTMRYFPRGCCELASDLFAYYLQQKGIESKVICGQLREQDEEQTCNHVWVDVDDLVVDLTANQFFGRSLYCGPYKDFYSSMKIIREEDPYNVMLNSKLLADYEVIVGYLNQ